jgi:hypothetical protein
MKEFLKENGFSIFWFVLAIAWIFMGEPAASVGCLVMGELHRMKDFMFEAITEFTKNGGL